ncbi:MAG: hypothetical protein ACYCW6_03840 [Candidatus Xenobia bacterium]
MPADDFTPQLFDALGPVIEARDGVTRYDLGHGIVRVSNPTSGSNILTGLVVHGLPADAGQEQGDIRVQIEAPAVHRLMADSTQALDAQSKTTADIQYTQTGLSPDGMQLTRIIPRPGRDPVPVYSQGPLSEANIRIMGHALAAMPPDGFRDGHTQIHILDWTGEWDYPGGQQDTFGGLSFFDRGFMFLPRDLLNDEQTARFAIWHETGHIMDGVWASAVGERHIDTARDADGQLLFTGDHAARTPQISALYSMDEIAHIGPADRCVSGYGATSGPEDFAETHSLAIALRQKYAQQHPNEDLFHLADAQCQAYLHDQPFSPGLDARLEDVIAHYR